MLITGFANGIGAEVVALGRSISARTTALQKSQGAVACGLNPLCSRGIRAGSPRQDYRDGIAP